MFLKTRIARGILAVEDAQFAEYHGRGADGSDEDALLVEGHESLLQRFTGPKVVRARHTAGQHNSVAFFYRTLAEEGIGHNGQIVRTMDEACACHTARLYGQTAAAQDVDGGDGFDFFVACG